MRTKKNNNQPKIDWNKAFVFYCEPDKRGRLRSYADVAEKFGVFLRTVEIKGSKFNWVERRENFGKKRVELWEKEKAETIKKIEQQNFAIWQDAVSLMQKQLTQLNRRQQDVELVDEIVEELFDELSRTEKKSERKEIKKKIANVMQRKVYSKEFRDTMEALKTSVNGLRVTMGMPTEITKGEMTNFNRDVKLSDEELEEMSKDFEKANVENKKAS